MHPIIPQIVGLLAVATFLISYQQNKRRDIIIFNTVSRILYIFQYILLGAYSGAVLDVMGAISSIIASKREFPFIKKHIKSVITVINATIILVGLVICRSLLDILPIIGVLLHTSAFWIENEKSIRRVSLCGSPFWFVYNFLSRAFGSALGDILTMMSIIIAMIRYDRKGKKKSK